MPDSAPPPPAGFAHIGLSYVVTTYCTEPGNRSLVRLLERYAGFAPDLLDRLQFVVVDDASPHPLALPEADLNLLVLRVREDIPWNNGGARNLGVVYARSDKVLVTDFDHAFDEATLRAALAVRGPGRTVYKFRRFGADGRPARAHPNTFLLSRARFLRFFGYDEEFCGHYGFEDAMLWRGLRYHGTRFRYLPRPCAARVRADEAGAPAHHLGRDLEHNRVIAERKRAEWARWGPQGGHSRLFLNFTWDVVLDRRRSTRPAPVPRPNWIRTWWLRQILPG